MVLRYESIKEFDVAWRKAVRRVLKIPADTHSYLLPLLMDSYLSLTIFTNVEHLLLLHA